MPAKYLNPEKLSFLGISPESMSCLGISPDSMSCLGISALQGLGGSNFPNGSSRIQPVHVGSRKHCQV